ncbi:hypothetical protein BDZ94DRAFT_1318907 [Collybia nuda]|uniref:Uncharacterized protein n=1 Tax=Collybia nuda TaxID=64659 RepID=A0A9P5YDY1_9AGAR|nr:hypothetical protein BDZ94DRAFT_1318907 [Collybia nuda]
MSSPHRPVHLPLLSKNYPSYASSTGTAYEEFVGAESHINKGEEEWADNFEKTGEYNYSMQPLESLSALHVFCLIIFVLGYDSDRRPRIHNPGLFGTLSTLRISCYILHLLLIAGHCVLLVLCVKDSHLYEVHIEYQRTLSVATTMISQAFTITYLALLVHLTQQLSLRRNLSIKQTLTATHDKAAAWTGLGSALSSLWSQMTVTASVGGVITITLYLASAAVLKVSTPSLFSVMSFNMSMPMKIQTETGSPFVMVPHDMTFATKTSVLQYMSLIPTPGLFANVLFDVPIDNDGIGHADVTTSTIDVRCGALSLKNTTTSQPGSFTKAKQSDRAEWTVRMPVQEPGGQELTYEGKISTMAINTLQIVTDPTAYRGVKESSKLLGPNILIIASTGIADSANNIPSLLPIEGEPMYPINSSHPISKLQAIGCSLFITTGTAQVDAQSKQLVKQPSQKSNSTWKMWSPLQSQNIWPTDSWPSFMTNSVSSPHTTAGKLFHQANDLSNMIIPPYLSMTEMAIMIGVNYLPKSEFGKDLNLTRTQPMQVRLHELENSIANVTAALFWISSHIGRSKSEELQNYANTTDIFQLRLVSHLKLNFVQIIIGLGTSVALFILALRIAGFTDDRKLPVERVGILHMIWLLGTGSMAQEHISRVEKPTTRGLREAGMFEMRISNSYTYVTEDAGSLMKLENLDR